MAIQGPVQRLGGGQIDLRDMLLMAGVGQYNAAMSIPYMNMLPGTTEPYAQGVLQLVQGLQRLLNQKGAGLTVDGGMGNEMIAALARYAGPRWPEKSWAQLYGDVIAGKPWPGYIRRDRNMVPRAAAQGGLGDAVTDLMTNPLALAAAGFAVWWKFFRKPARGGGASTTTKLLAAGELEDL